MELLTDSTCVDVIINEECVFNEVRKNLTNTTREDKKIVLC